MPLLCQMSANWLMMQCIAAAAAHLSRCSCLIIFQFLVAALNFAVIQYIFYWHIAFTIAVAVAAVVCGCSYNCLEWLKYMNKQRRARIHSPHNCLSTCRTNGSTPLFDFKQTDKNAWYFALCLLIHSLTRLVYGIFIPVDSSAYIVVVLSLIFVCFPIASCFIINA